MPSKLARAACGDGGGTFPPSIWPRESQASEVPRQSEARPRLDSSATCPGSAHGPLGQWRDDRVCPADSRAASAREIASSARQSPCEVARTLRLLASRATAARATPRTDGQRVGGEVEGRTAGRRPLGIAERQSPTAWQDESGTASS